MRAKLIKTEDGFRGRKIYTYACIECGTEFIKQAYNEKINPYCCKCKNIIDKERNKKLAEIRQAKHDAEIIKKTVYAMQEKLCNEMEKHATPARPVGWSRELEILTLDNAVDIIFEVSEQLRSDAE